MRAAMRAQREAERRYPVRVRIAVPPEGPARDHPCLARRDVRRRRVGNSGRRDDGRRQRCPRALFEDAAFAGAFVARFCCGYRVETIAGALAVRCDTRPARRGRSAHKTP
jgi:hypothetical protein